MWKYLVLVFLFIALSAGQSDKDNELGRNNWEKEAVDKLRERFSGTNLEPKWLLDDLYLTRYLRHSLYNVDAAERTILQIADWRKENRIDDVIQESYPDLFKMMPYYVDSLDKQGRPVLFLSLEEWNLRDFQALTKEQRKRVIRYFDQTVENVRARTHSIREEGNKNVTGALAVVDLNNFIPLGMDFCRRINCWRFTTEYFNDRSFSHHIDHNYMFEKTIIINAEPWIQSSIRMVNLIPGFSESFEVYGKDKGKWAKRLQALIADEELYQEFGGKKSH